VKFLAPKQSRAYFTKKSAMTFAIAEVSKEMQLNPNPLASGPINTQ